MVMLQWVVVATVMLMLLPALAVALPPMKSWDAAWIWLPAQPAPRDNLNNQYVHARQVVNLTTASPAAVVYVTAGSLYKLWVNGEYVGRGPNPGDPSFYYYDVYDVGHLLKAGENVIALTAYCHGPDNHSVTHQNWGPGGMLLELRDRRDGQLLAATDDTWRVMPAPEFDQAAELNNQFLSEYKETCDTRQMPDGWRSPGFDASAWQVPTVLGRPPVAPYTRLLEREIPMLGGKRYFPGDAYFESASVAFYWRDDLEIYHEQNLVPGGEDRSGKPLQAYRSHADFAPSVTLDFRHLVTGYPEISIQGSAGGTIQVLYGESLHMSLVDRFILNGKPQVLQPFGRRTFRYLKLVFVDTPDKIFIDRVSCDMDTYPVEYKGKFRCNDERLNKIFDVSQLTIHLSMLDHFVDCPWRERTIYGGDLYNENLIAMYAFGDVRLTHKSLRQMFAIQFAQGAVPPLGPYGGYPNFYPSWTAFTGLALLDDYELSGDRAFLLETWPNLVRILDWTIDQIEHNEPHLIGRPLQGGDIAAWSAHGPKTDFGAWGNLPFYSLLARSAALAADLGKTAEARRYQQAADLMADAVRRHQIAPDGLFQMYPPAHRPDQSVMFNNSLLVWSHVLDAAASARTLDGMLAGQAGVNHSPFHALFTGMALFDHHRPQAALDDIRGYYGSMLDRGATTFWEHYTPTMRPAAIPTRGESLNHGWSAGPAYLLPAYVLGVRPLAPGFAKVLIAPQSGDLEWAEGDVPTPHGNVHVRWEHVAGKLHLTLDTPVPARVELPDGVHEVAAGQHDLSSGLQAER